MANTLLFLLIPLLSTLHLAAAQKRYSNISQGSSLTPTGNSFWPSPSGLYAFGFYKEGNGYAVGIFIFGIPQRTVVWTANRENPPVSDEVSLFLTTNDGRFILQQREATDIVAVSESIFSASMLDSGNFVLYNSDMQIIWQSFEHPTDTLLPTQHLQNSQALFSSISATNHSQGFFGLVMQEDGNLVQYPRGDAREETAYYASRTNEPESTMTLNLDADGHLYLINAYNRTFHLTSGFSKEQKLYLMRLDVDGIFRVYSYDLDRKSDWSIEWASSTDKCVGNGLCGLNAFCTLIDDEAKCVCLPGFDFVSPDSWSFGCERNYTSGSCKNEYSMRKLENTRWENSPYYVLKTSSGEDCEAACKEDCNCEAALFDDRECRKQKLPLRYGRRSPSYSSTGFVKVGLAKAVENGVQPDVPKGPKESKKELHLDILIISVSLLALAFMVFVISVVLVVYKNKIWAYKKIPENVELMEDVAPRAFTYAELEKVTTNFQDELGRGASGIVYKGTLQNNQKLVAVKRLEKVLTEEDREFQNEMKVIGRTHHRNLVRLLGYSIDGPKKLLVYEYMHNGSLADVLFTPKFRLRWDERISIALDIARGIVYLHEECETQIIHCDIKPQNILMDGNRSAKISDFGLAKLLKPDQTNSCTGIRGTRGYVAPEWHRNMPITVKVDVYSFGIVLLEIICCRRSLDTNVPEEECVLEEWVYQCFENGKLHKLIVDEKLDKKKLDRMVSVSLWCILEDPSLRPSMKKVLLMLEGIVDIPVPPGPTSYLSAI